ncbi:PTS mannose/fructose/sorbose family IIA subunit [Enterococcus ureilyticus]|uniref:PTS mannose/fructose/sorbose family IIA subunit n=1 Tax=Enterococcus ureilyticus TaxID=1131292 RepID=A0A1E5HAM9_9ENTE|nr:PTS sugar transporter subunit IIA [Enterococcus ureilyticus]MBM7688181.1 mannose/fructose/sorbose-specific phosphotransferase system IIA component [Enterococcus ureilyticus]MBO0445453.1 PTS sugar transporter subunit IIA [Enterococcus ureilyticus]OEG21875.1 PTS mannose/fructose/sorbose family IIA subunit [Enterococcus ureilyticus]
MTKVVLVAHGKLALEMKNSAEMIFGELSHFSAIEFSKHDGLESLSEKIMKDLKKSNEETLLITDLFCGTPYNASCSICMKEPTLQIEVISGMSLPMVLEVAAMIDATPLSQVVNIVKEAAAETVKSFKEQVIKDEEEF